jgi:transcriptional regulator with XRE-family HTH domain
MTLGERIKARRVQLGLSPTRLAEMANVSRATITELENGHQRTASSADLRGLARALSITLDQLTDRQVAA